MRLFSAFLALFALLPFLNGQSGAAFWTPVAPDDVALPAGSERQFEPLQYRAFRLDYAALTTRLATAPLERTAAAAQNACRIALPMADGSFETFAIEESPVLESELQARYPEIRTYRGVSLETPGKVLRLSYSPYHGLHVFLRRPDKGTELIERVAPGQDEYYMVYDNRDYPYASFPAGAPVTVGGAGPVDERYAPGPPQPEERGSELNGEVIVKVYRLAVSTTGEFSQANGGTKPAVLAKVTAVIN
jgi:hypothetical protein